MIVHVAGGFVVVLALVVIGGSLRLWSDLSPLRRAGFFVVSLGFALDGLPWLIHGQVDTLTIVHSVGTILSVSGLAALLLSDAREFARIASERRDPEPDLSRSGTPV